MATTSTSSAESFEPTLSLEQLLQHSPSLESCNALQQATNDASDTSTTDVGEDGSSTADESASNNDSPDTTPLASPGLPNETGLPPTPPSNSVEAAQSADFTPPPFADGVMSSLISKRPSLSTPVNQRSPLTPDPSPPRPSASKASLRPPRPAPLQYPSSRCDSFKTAREAWSSSASLDHSTRSITPTQESMKPLEMVNLADGPDDQSRDVSDAQLIGDGGETTPALGTVAENASGGDQLSDGAGYEHIPNREWDTNLMRNVTVRRKGYHPGTSLQEHPSGDRASTTQLTPEPNHGRSRRDEIGRNLRMSSMEKFAAEIGWPSDADLDLTLLPSSTDDKRNSTASTQSTVVEAIIMVTPPQQQRTLRHVKKNIPPRSPTDGMSTTRSNRTSLNSGDVPLHKLVHKKSRILERANRSSGGSSNFSFPSSDNSSGSPPPSRHASDQVRETIPVMVIPTDGAPSPTLSKPTYAPAHHEKPRSNPEAMPAREMDWDRLDVPRRRGTHNAVNAFASTNSKAFSGSVPAYIPLSALQKRLTGLATSSNERRISSSPAKLLARPVSEEAIPPQVPPKDYPRKRARSPQREGERHVPDSVAAMPIPVLEETKASPDPQESIYRAAGYERIGTPSHSDVHVDHPANDDHPRSSFDASTLHPNRRVSFDHPVALSDAHSIRRLLSPSTPFSQASEPAEVREATAVTLYPHTNKSILEVQHTLGRQGTTGRTSSEVSQKDTDTVIRRYTPELPEFVPYSAVQHDSQEVLLSDNDSTIFLPPAERKPESPLPQSEPLQRPSSQGQPTVQVQPSTPQEGSASKLEVESPLKNPREAPQPPAVKIIPPTPSEELERELPDPVSAPPGPPDDADRPVRLLNLVQLARRYSDNLIPQFLGRRPSTAARQRIAHLHRAHRNAQLGVTTAPSVTDATATDERLHPFWRPRGFWDDLSDSEAEEVLAATLDVPPGPADRLPEGGDTSDVQSNSTTDTGAGAAKLVRRLTNSFRGSGAFLIGNSLGVERHGTNVRKPRVELLLPLTTRRPVTARHRVRKSGSHGSLRSATAASSSTASARSVRSSSSTRSRLRKERPAPAATAAQQGLAPPAAAETHTDLWTRPKKHTPRTLPGGVQVQYIGIRGVADRIRGRMAEKRREKLKRSIGTERTLVQGTGVGVV